MSSFEDRTRRKPSAPVALVPPSPPLPARIDGPELAGHPYPPRRTSPLPETGPPSRSDLECGGHAAAVLSAQEQWSRRFASVGRSQSGGMASALQIASRMGRALQPTLSSACGLTLRASIGGRSTRHERDSLPPTGWAGLFEHNTIYASISIAQAP
jgi:hypothetical protein